MRIGLLSSQVTDRLYPEITIQQIIDEAVGAEKLGFDKASGAELTKISETTVTLIFVTNIWKLSQ